MRKILITLLLIPLLVQAQHDEPKDTTPIYKIMFITDSLGFVNQEYLIKTTLNGHGEDMLRWDFPYHDTTDYNIWGMNTPEPDRLSSIEALSPIIDSINKFAYNYYIIIHLSIPINEKIILVNTELYKLQITASMSVIPYEYKVLINTMQFMNIKKFKQYLNFNNFK